MALGLPGRLRPRIFSTFGTTSVVGRQPNAPAAFTPGEIPGTHFQRLSRLQGTWFCRKEPRKKSPVQLVAQLLNHYALPGPNKTVLICNTTLFNSTLSYYFLLPFSSKRYRLKHLLSWGHLRRSNFGCSTS